METTRDKQIREKLNSLNTLPEGYTPSLDSKWELLLAGKPEKKERSFYGWYAAAASALLLLSFSFLYFKNQKQLLEKAIAEINTPISAKKTLAILPEKPETKLAVTTPSKAIIENKKAFKNAMPTPVKTQLAARKIPTSETFKPETQIQTSEPGISTAENAPILAVTESPKMPRKKKTTFVEMDFDSPQSVKFPRPETRMAQINFKLKLLPKDSDPDATVMQTDKPFRLQHTF